MADLIPIGQRSEIDIDAMSVEQLRAELARGLELTAEVLYRLGAVWRRLTELGEDLSDIGGSLARTLPLIASGQLAAEAVVAFSGRPIVLRQMEGLPLPQQRELAAGQTVEVYDPNRPREVQRMPLADVPYVALRRVLSGGRVHTASEQRLATRKKANPGEQPKRRRFKPVYNPETGDVTVGRMKIALGDIVAAVSSAMGADRPPSDDPADYLHAKTRLTEAEYAELQAHARRVGLPDWEMIRKALRAFGLIGAEHDVS